MESPRASTRRQFWHLQVHGMRCKHNTNWLPHPSGNDSCSSGLYKSIQTLHSSNPGWHKMINMVLDPYTCLQKVIQAPHSSNHGWHEILPDRYTCLNKLIQSLHSSNPARHAMIPDRYICLYKSLKALHSSNHGWHKLISQVVTCACKNRYKRCSAVILHGMNDPRSLHMLVAIDTNTAFQ